METFKRSIIKIPYYTVIEFALNSSSNHYQKCASTNTNEIYDCIPNILRVEKSRKPGIRKNVNWVIADLNKSGKHLFFTGLKPTSATGHQFIGDHLKYYDNKRAVSLIYFVFKNDFSGFTLFYFDGYTKPPKLLPPFCRAFKNHLKSLGKTGQ